MICKRTSGKMTGTTLVGLSGPLASVVPAQAAEEPNSKLSGNQVAAARAAKSAQAGAVQTRSTCGHVLGGVAATNGLPWAAAGLTARTGNLPAAAVADVAGAVTLGIIGAAEEEC